MHACCFISGLMVGCPWNSRVTGNNTRRVCRQIQASARLTLVAVLIVFGYKESLDYSFEHMHACCFISGLMAGCPRWDSRVTGTNTRRVCRRIQVSATARVRD